MKPQFSVQLSHYPASGVLFSWRAFEKHMKPPFLSQLHQFLSWLHGFLCGLKSVGNNITEIRLALAALAFVCPYFDNIPWPCHLPSKDISGKRMPHQPTFSKTSTVVGTFQRQDRSLFNIFSSTLTSFHRLSSFRPSLSGDNRAGERGRERSESEAWSRSSNPKELLPRFPRLPWPWKIP